MVSPFSSKISILFNTLYNLLLKRLSDFSVRHKSGIFGADMDIHSINKGPVTFLFDI